VRKKIKVRGSAMRRWRVWLVSAPQTGEHLLVDRACINLIERLLSLALLNGRWLTSHVMAGLGPAAEETCGFNRSTQQIG
jgi:hypothetical protein